VFRDISRQEQELRGNPREIRKYRFVKRGLGGIATASVLWACLGVPRVNTRARKIVEAPVGRG
jgi:hypothetical protein